MTARWIVLALVIGCGGSDGAPADAGGREDARPRDAAGGVDAGGERDAPMARDSGPEPQRVRSTDFAEADGEVLNPDRGFYWWDWNEEASLVLVKGQLGDHCAAATLPASVIETMRARLTGHRAAGRRVVLRFVYADDGVLNACGRADAESIEIVEGHVAQLAGVMDEHADVIAYVEAGFFGMWGEWNSEHAPPGTSLWDGEENRRRVLRALLDAVPPERTILVRRPRFRDELSFTAAELGRIGFHNDCFLASATDFGTYDGARSVEEWKTYVRAATTMVPLGGETCQDAAMFTSCDHATMEMETLRFAYLHEGYHADVIARWSTEGCLPEVRERLGYRMVARAVEASAEIAAGQTLRVRVELENVGYAPPYSTRRLQLVLRNGSDAVTLTPLATEDADTRSWAPGEPIAVELAADLTGGVFPGAWEIRLRLLEDRGDTPAFAMLFANDDRVRDDARRENVLGQVVVAGGGS